MNAKQQKIFDSILDAVPKQGWTLAAIEQGGAEARKLFPDVESLVAAFHQSIDEKMLAAIRAHRKFAALRVRDKITFAVKARLEAVAEQEVILRRLLIWSVMPKHLSDATRYLWGAADMIWKEAGDTSSDYNYYTKRLLLSGVMKATLSFWLNDASKGHAETWAFLDRRINDVMMLGKGIGAVKAVGVSDILSFVRSRFTKMAV